MKSSKSSKTKNNLTDLDLFSSIPKQPDYDPFSGIESLLMKRKTSKKEDIPHPTSDPRTTKEGHMSDKSPTVVSRSSDNHPTSDSHPTHIRHSPHPHTSYTQTTSDIKTLETNNRCDPDNPIWSITDRHSIILGYLILNQTGLSKRASLQKKSNIPLGTIKDSLKILTKEKFITRPNRFKNHGFTYKIYRDQCEKFMEHRWPKILKFYGNPPSIHPTSDPQTSHAYPSSNVYTEKHPLSIISSSRNLLLNKDTELVYWKRKGLTEKQIQQWLEVVNCDESTMLRYLSYCRFDMVNHGLEESKPIDNVFNWFFKILEKTGGYPKPKGYKSFEEKRLEEKREAVVEQERIAKEQEEIYRRKIRSERDTEFFKMLNNPDSELHKKCFEMLNDFTKKRIGKKSFEVGMRANFDKLMEED